MLKLEPSPRSRVWVARAGNVVMVLPALRVMTQLTPIAIAWQTGLLLAAMGVVLVLRWIRWRMTASLLDRVDDAVFGD